MTNLMVLDGEQDEATLSLFEERLILLIEIDVANEPQSRRVKIVVDRGRVICGVRLGVRVVLGLGGKRSGFHGCEGELVERRGNGFAWCGNGHNVG